MPARKSGHRFFFLLSLVWIGGCQEPLPPQPARLRIAISTTPTTLDPRRCGDYLSSTLACLLYEGLTRPLPGGGWERALAEEIEEFEGGRVYRFHLREACWSDGAPITAYDFEASWRRVIDPSFPSPCRYLLYPIRRGKECAEGILPPEALGVRALSPKLLQVELERPTPHFLALTGFPLLLPAPLHREGEEETLFPSSGPFRIEKSSRLGELALVKNERYWRRSEISLEGVTFYVIPDEGTALQLFCRGELDWIGSPLSPLPQEAIEAPPAEGRLEFHPMAATTFCSFNTEHPLLSHPKVRRALSFAIDREEIVSQLTRSGQIAAYSPLPPPLSLKEGAPFLEGSPLALFEEGLAELNLEKEKLTLSFRSGQLERRLAQVLQKQWREGLGLEVALQEVDPKSHLHHLQERRYEIALTSWIAQVLDPLNLLERLAQKNNPKNYPGWENGRFSQLLQQALTSSPEERTSALTAAEALLLEEAPLAPLYHWANPSLSSKRLAPLEAHATGGLLFERASLQ